MLEYGISKFDLKVINRAQIMRTVWEFGPISRSDIADKLCITRAAITVITNEMMEEGFLKEIGKNTATGEYESSKGRRKVLLDINPESSLLMGVYIDRYHMSVGLATIKGDILEKENFNIDPDISSKELISIAEKSLKCILMNSCLEPKHIAGLGVGIMPDMPECISKQIENDGQYYEHLQKSLYDIIGVPVFVDNAVSQFAVVCWSRNRRDGRHCTSSFVYSDDDSFYLTHILNMPSLFERCATTVGVNSLCVKRDGHEMEGALSGSVKAELTNKAIGRKVANIYSENRTPALYRLTGGAGSVINIAQIMTAVSLGDDALKELKEELLDELSILINNMISISEVENIYFYKFGFTKEHIQEIKAHYERNFRSLCNTKLNICDITDDHRFICGCFYAVFKGVFSVNRKVVGG